MARESGCAFCDIVANEAPARIISRGRGVTVFFPDEPATLGHTMVVPDDHVADIWGLDQGTARNLASEVLRVSHAIRGALKPEGLNLIQSNGTAAGQTIGHLHVHVLPRWAGDAVGDLWPVSPSWSASELDSTQASVVAAVESATVRGYDLTNDQDREDRRKHLDLLSGAINRMAGSSAAAKGWAIALAGTAFGVALVRESAPLIALGILVVASFGLLDARYLENERRARNVYAGVADDNAIAPFSMKGLATGSTVNHWWWPARFRSWSIWYFYGPLVVGGVVLLVLALSSPSDDDSRLHDHPTKSHHGHSYR